jgi:hypothetical protein
MLIKGVGMKKLLIIPVLLAALTVGLAFSAANRTSAVAGQEEKAIVGVWEVDADAPYRPHLFTFHADGTMTTTNPTNVQENSSAPHGGTNDSLGMGVWKVVKEGTQTFVIGTFEQLNAFADNHQPTDKLSVSFKVQVTNGGEGFDGPASATVGADTFPSHITGTRVNIDQNAVNALP